MLFSTIGQNYVFLWMTGAGLIIGALYALCAGLRRLLEAGFWLTLLIDIVFGLGAAAILIAALVTGAYGAVRLYELLGAALGVILFELGFAPVIRSVLKLLRYVIRRIYDTVSHFRLIKVIFK